MADRKSLPAYASNSTTGDIETVDNVKFAPSKDELQILMSLMDTDGKGFVSMSDMLRIASLKDANLGINKKRKHSLLGADSTMQMTKSPSRESNLRAIEEDDAFFYQKNGSKKTTPK